MVVLMKYLLILTLIILSACNESKSIKNNLNYNHELVSPIQSTIEMIQELELDYARNIIMVNSTDRERDYFIAAIQEIETILYILLNKPNDEKALERLYQRVLNFNKIPLQRRDLEFISPLKRQLMPLVNRVALFQNTTRANIHWQVYLNTFSKGLDLFTTIDKGLSWRAQDRNRVTYVSTAGSEGEAWLISPLIDLSLMKNAAFRINYLINLREGNTNNNSKLFKILVSDNYEFGEPSNADWDKLELTNLNIVNDFTPLWSPKISLNSYANKTISIAYKFSKEKNQNIVAQINDFQLFGALYDENTTEEDFIIQRKDPIRYLYQHSFSNGIDNFEQISEGDSPAKFQITERNGAVYAEANSFNAKNSGVTYLVSPIIELGEEDYAIQVEQSINFYKQPAKDANFIQILYTVINEAEEENWQILNFKNIPNGDNWDVINSEWINLNHKNKRIKIAFRYESGTIVKEYPNWQLHNLNIKVVE
jgi:hypothetical protein